MSCFVRYAKWPSATAACFVSLTQAPEEIKLREVKVKHQVLVATLVDHRRVRKACLSALYAHR